MEAHNNMESLNTSTESNRNVLVQAGKQGTRNSFAGGSTFEIGKEQEEETKKEDRKELCQACTAICCVAFMGFRTFFGLVQSMK